MPQRARRNRRTPDVAIRAGVTVLQAIVGVYVATRRKNRSQSDVADQVGTTQAALSDLETGKRFISAEVAQKIFENVGIAHSVELADVYGALHRLAKAHGRNI